MIKNATRECPNCRHTIPIDSGYPPWCDRCEWNLEGIGDAPAKKLGHKVAHEIGSTISKRLLKSVLASGPVAPKLTTSRLAALAIAGLIYLTVLVLAIAGVLLLIEYRTLPLTMLGVVLVIAAVMMRPRFPREPQEDFLPRENFPKLYEITDRIADHFGTRRVDRILVYTEFNAAYFRGGLSRRRYLLLGIPLFEILTPQERIALIAHELAHGANGDSSRGLFVGTAMESLNAWRARYYSDDEVVADTLGNTASLILLGLPWLSSRLCHLLSHLLVLLMANDSQRGEYLADHMGARAGGTKAMVAIMHKMHMAYAVYLAVDRFYEAGTKQGLFSVLRRRLEHVPPREIERVARIEKLVDSSLDASHPSSASRIQVLEAWPVTQPEVVLSTEDLHALERELALVRPELETLMLQDYQDRTEY